MTHNTDDSGFDQPSLDELIALREAAKFSGLSASHALLFVKKVLLQSSQVEGHKLVPGVA